MDDHEYYIYMADCYCDGCMEKWKEEHAAHKPEDADDETTYDSDEWPKGPFSQEESDTPQHCGNGEDCVNAITLKDGTKIGAMLDSELTHAGVEYVKEEHAEGPTEVTELWIEHFGSKGYDFPKPGMVDADLQEGE